MDNSRFVMDRFYELQREMLREHLKYGPFRSPHEFAAILREEYLECETEIFHGDIEKARVEALQIAAVAYRFYKMGVR